MKRLRKSLLASCIAAASCTAVSAAHINESFDGAWQDTSAQGARKGLLLDYIPGPRVVFFTMFSYTDEGEQLWFQNVIPVQDGVRDYTVNAVALTGGQSAAPGTPVEQTVGTINFSFNCDAIGADFTPAEGQQLTAANFNFIRPLDALTTQDCNLPVATCPTGTTSTEEGCQLPSDIEGSLMLPAGRKYIVLGQVTVEDGGVLTIAPGVTVQGSADNAQPNFLAVKQGGRIYAEGTPNQPITFTGPEATPGSWAGLVIAGRSDCNDAPGVDGGCQFEAVPEIVYGGSDPDDNSGRLRYVRILWAGQSIAPNEELNSLTMLAVGRGTVMEYIQVDGGLDDGFEWFGGTVDGRYLVCSNMGDDCFDSDQGFTGRVQFALGWQGNNPDIGSDSNGIESDNDNPASDALPRTIPVFSNVTLIGNPEVGNEGIRIRRGAGADYWNFVVHNYRDRCVNLINAQTYALATGTAQSNQLQLRNSWVGTCGTGQFDDNAAEAYAVSAWYAAGEGNGAGDPMLRANGFQPTMGSPLMSGGQAPGGAFFRPASYRGAFAGPNDNWTAGWTVNIPSP
jgi:hypothetical protein